MSIFIFCLIVVCVIAGVIERATAGYRRVMRNARARNRNRRHRRIEIGFGP